MWSPPNSDHVNVAAEVQTRQTRQRVSSLLCSSSGESVWIVASVSCSQLSAVIPGGLLLLQNICFSVFSGFLIFPHLYLEAESYESVVVAQTGLVAFVPSCYLS